MWYTFAGMPFFEHLAYFTIAAGLLSLDRWVPIWYAFV
jgi:hypothetical protein